MIKSCVNTIGFINFILNAERLTDFNNLFSPKTFKEIIK